MTGSRDGRCCVERYPNPDARIGARDITRRQRDVLPCDSASGCAANPFRWPRSRPYQNAVAGLAPATSVVPLRGKAPQVPQGELT